MEPTPRVPRGLSTQREVDAIFSAEKHFTPKNTYSAPVSTGVTLEYALHTKHVEGAVGEERVVMIMGFMETQDAWAGVVDLIQEKWSADNKNLTLATFDNRGCGGSTTGWGYCSTSIMAQDALALMDHLGWDKAHVVGLSMGGMISLELAATAPDRVKSLSLMVTTRGRFESSGATKFIIEMMTAKDQDSLLQRTLETFYPKGFLDKLLESEFGSKTYDVLHKYHKERMQNARPQALSGIVSQSIAIRTHFVSDARLATIGAQGFPVLIIGCSGDSLIPGVESVKLWNGIGHKSARIVYFDEAAHCVAFQCPHEVTQEIVDTIRDGASNL